MCVCVCWPERTSGRTTNPDAGQAKPQGSATANAAAGQSAALPPKAYISDSGKVPIAWATLDPIPSPQELRALAGHAVIIEATFYFAWLRASLPKPTSNPQAPPRTVAALDIDKEISHLVRSCL